jgi:hypothetical protein
VETKDSFVSIGDSVVLRVEAVDKQISLKHLNQSLPRRSLDVKK